MKLQYSYSWNALTQYSYIETALNTMYIIAAQGPIVKKALDSTTVVESDPHERLYLFHMNVKAAAGFASLT